MNYINLYIIVLAHMKYKFVHDTYKCTLTNNDFFNHSSHPDGYSCAK
jgi:hypothetical protein